MYSARRVNLQRRRDGDVAAEVLIASAIDLAHPTRTNLFDDAVMRERFANHGKGPLVAAILGPARRQVNATPLLREVHACLR